MDSRRLFGVYGYFRTWDEPVLICLTIARAHSVEEAMRFGDEANATVTHARELVRDGSGGLDWRPTDEDRRIADV